MTKTAFLITTKESPSIENINVLIDYLISISGKPLGLKCRRQNAFKTKWKDREVRLIARCHVQNAIEYLGYLRKNYTTNQIQVVTSELSSYVKYLDPNEDISRIGFSTNTRPSAVQFEIAEKLFYNHEIVNQNNYSLDLFSVYALRLSLESRIKGLLGIDYVEVPRGKVNLSSLIRISKSLKSIEYLNDVNWDEVVSINEWLNHYMHRHIRPYPWVIHQAIESLKPLINPKEPLVKGDRIIHSFYSAAFVENEKALEAEFERAIKSKYEKAKIYWSIKKREIAK